MQINYFAFITYDTIENSKYKLSFYDTSRNKNI